jgi:hypothetical protein
VVVRPCAGHDKYAARGSHVVVHVDCSAEIATLLHGNVRRCATCHLKHKTFSTLRATRKWNLKTRTREETRDGCS